MEPMVLDQAFRARVQIVASIAADPEGASFRNWSFADVCHVAGVSKSKFYRLFSSIDDIPVWWQRACAYVGLHQVGRLLTCREGHLVSLGLQQRVSTLFSGLTKPGSDTFSRQAVTQHARIWGENLRAKGFLENSARLDYELYASAFAAHEIASRWDDGGMADMGLSELVDLICEFVPERVRVELDHVPAHRSGPEELARRAMALELLSVPGPEVPELEGLV